MGDLTRILCDRDLQTLRSGYRHEDLVDANVRTVATHVPALAKWNEQVADTFYRSSTLAPIDRERCLIVLLVASGPALPLALHLYWGLVEGLSVSQILEITGLASCYAGISRLGSAMDVVQRVLNVLTRACSDGRSGTPAVMQALVAEFSSISTTY